MGYAEDFERVLSFAIEGEVEATRFYRQLAAKADQPAMAVVFEAFAKEEEGHKAKLEKLKSGKMDAASEMKPVADLKVADYVVDIEPTPDMSFEDAIVLAMQREKAAFRLYSDLAACAAAPEIRDLFLSLAQEEAKHKLRFEIAYDESLAEN